MQYSAKLEGKSIMAIQFGLKEETTNKIKLILSRYHQVEKAIIYGSRAKGNYKNGSDIDLTLLGGEDLTHPMLHQIMKEIDDLFLPYSFDLSILKDITDKDVLDHIQRVGKVFYERGENNS